MVKFNAKARRRKEREGMGYAAIRASFVRIRIRGISIRPACDSRHNGNADKTNTDERLPVKDEPAES